MPLITRQEVDTAVNNQLPTNGVGAITAAQHRSLMSYILDYIDQKSKIFYGEDLPSDHIEPGFLAGEFGVDGDYYIQTIEPGVYQFWVKESNAWVETNSLGTNNGKNIFFTLTTLPYPVAENPGDMWFNFALSSIYLWDGLTWGAYHPIGPRNHFGAVNPSPSPTYKQQDTYLNLETAEFFKYLNGAWVSQGTLQISGIAPIPILYADLEVLAATSSLQVGRYYTITDFRTVYAQPGSDPAYQDTIGEAVEHLTVRAIQPAYLSTLATSKTYPNDIIHYSLYDTTMMAPTTGSKGVILYREDPIKKLSAHYDWRHVRFKRWDTVAGNGQRYAFTKPSGSPGSSDVLTFANLNDGGSCTNCMIGPGTINVVIGADSHGIEVKNECGEMFSGITIGRQCKSISIDSDSARVGGSGSGYVNGITILDNVYNCYIGQRCYNIVIGVNCYALHIGTQASDIAVPPSVFRRRIEKGYSNFETDLTLTSDTIDLSNKIVEALEGVLWGSASYCGVINLSGTAGISTTPVNGIIPNRKLRRLIAHSTSVVFHPITLRVKPGGSTYTYELVDLNELPVVNANANFELKGHNLEFKDSINTEGVGDYVTLHKFLLDGLGLQSVNWLLHNTNTSNDHWPNRVTGIEKRLPISHDTDRVYEIAIDIPKLGGLPETNFAISGVLNNPTSIALVEAFLSIQDNSGGNYPTSISYLDSSSFAINAALTGGQTLRGYIRYIKQF